MTVRPERGGRITSLTLRGHELLEQGIGVDHPQKTDFVASGAQGWDEMVPNVEPGVYRIAGRPVRLPDHGEAWRLPWHVDSRTRSATTMTVAGRILPWTLERRVQLLSDRVLASYVYTNTAASAMPAYWCAHPLFKYEPRMRIGPLSVARPRAGRSTKEFLARGTADRVTLEWPAGHGIEVSWDPALTPYVAIWVCNGDLGGYRQIAIEPATGGGDGPRAKESPPRLQTGQTMAWWLQIRQL